MIVNLAQVTLRNRFPLILQRASHSWHVRIPAHSVVQVRNIFHPRRGGRFSPRSSRLGIAIVGVQEVCACRTITIPNGRIDPNPLQLPFPVAGAVVFIGGLSFQAVQLFRRQYVKISVKD